MSQPKIKIGKVSLERIRNLSEHGKSVNYIANKYAWPRSVINRIIAGKDVEYFRRKPKGRNKPKIEGKCTICGTEPRDIPPGTPPNQNKWFKFCKRCRPIASDYEVDEYRTGQVYTDMGI